MQPETSQQIKLFEQNNQCRRALVGAKSVMKQMPASTIVYHKAEHIKNVLQHLFYCMTKKIL